MNWIALFAVAAGCASAQQLDLSVLDKLAPRASEHALVTLDQDKLRLAAGFLGGNDPDQKKTKELLSAMKGVYVRTFEFDKDNAYNGADLDPIRKQLNTPAWAKIVDVKSRGESTEVYLFSKDNQYGGLAVLAAEPREIAVVNIVGPVDLATLTELGGKFGIPAIGSTKKATTPPARTPPPAKD
jgi:hypothetical protein